MTGQWTKGLVVPTVLLGIASSAGAADGKIDASELARCAVIAAANERLACYDSLAAVAVPGIHSSSASVNTAAVPTAVLPSNTGAAGTGAGATGAGAATSAGATSAGSTAAAGTAVPAPAAAPPSTNPDDPANFGLTRHQLKAVPEGPGSIKSVVSQLTVDRLNKVILVLDNGQTWEFVDPDPRVRPGDSITIKRASLGSFLMITPSRRSYRVERVK